MSGWQRPGEEASWLPPGKTCADCRHLDLCVAVFAGNPIHNACDWSPSRFAPRNVKGGQA